MAGPIVRPEIVKVGYGELESENELLLGQLVATYIKVFNEQSGYVDDAHEEGEVRERILRQVGRNPEQMLLLLALLPDSVAGFLWSCGRWGRDEVVDEMVYTTTLFMGNDRRRKAKMATSIESVLGGIPEKDYDRMEYVPENGVLSAHRSQGLNGMMMLELALSGKKRGVDDYIFWATEGGESPGEVRGDEMYWIMLNVLGGEVVGRIEEGLVIMRGSYVTAAKGLTKRSK